MYIMDYVLYVYLFIGNIFLILSFLKTMNSSLNNDTPISVVIETSANSNKRKKSSLTIEQKATMYVRWEEINKQVLEQWEMSSTVLSQLLEQIFKWHGKILQ
jgi:hypothetical protein